MNSYLVNMPRKGLSKFLEEDEKRKEEERFTDEVNFSTETRVNTDKGYKEEFDRDQTFLQKTGNFVMDVLSLPEKLDKAVGIYGTRQKAIQAVTGGLSEDHLIAALAGEMLVPDTLDIITLGLGYIPRRVLSKGPKAIKMFLKYKKSKLPKAAYKSRAVTEAGKVATDADYDGIYKAAQTSGFLGNLKKQVEAITSGELFGVTGGSFPKKPKGKLKKIQPTTTRDLGLYGAMDDMFEDLGTTSLNTALQGGSVRGGRFVKLKNATTGQPEYYTVFTRGGKTQILPYNTWYQKNVNPFMVPKKLLETLKMYESGQQGDLLRMTQKGTKLTPANPGGLPTVKIPVGTKGKFKTVVAPTKFPSGTVDEFNNWYKGVFKLQKEEQALNRQISIMLEKLGNIQARNPGKKVFDTDLSHIAPRSKGGSGLTFQEAWILNQQRGATDILDDKVLAAAGIPKNWEELFYYWLAQKGKSGRELQTAIGPLSQINVDDYFALSKGEPLNVVGKRRKDIRNMVNRQIGNPDQYRMPGKRGTFQDDFEAAVRASKAGQVGGDIFLNDKLLDIRWVAQNFDDLVEIGDI